MGSTGRWTIAVVTTLLAVVTAVTWPVSASAATDGGGDALAALGDAP